MNTNVLRKKAAPFLFIAPAAIGVFMFTAIPFGTSAVMSFFKWKGFADPEFIGFKNYIHLLTQNEFFWISLKNTALYVGLFVPLRITASLSLAVAVNRKLPGMRAFRLMYFLPVITAGTAMSIVWKWIYNPNYGLANWILSIFSIRPVFWLTNPKTAMLSVVIMSVWGSAGYGMVIYLAALVGIPRELYDSAAVDGANPWSRFWRITFPQLAPVTFFMSITGIIGSFQVFGSIYVMTQGGPGTATLVYNYYLYVNAFEYYRFGYASAMAWILFIIIIGITALQWKVARRKETYNW